MSENEDFESLKVTELQNELKKRGLDTKGRKLDLIDRLRQAVNSDSEGDTTSQNSILRDAESAATIGDDDTSSPLTTIKGDHEQEQTSAEANAPPGENLPLDEQRSDESPASKKRQLTDEDTEKIEELEDNTKNDTKKDAENNTNTNTNDDDTSKQRRKKKSRWGSEQDEESPEKQSTSKQTSDEDDDDDDDDNSSRHREREHDRDYHRSSRQRDDDRRYSSRRSEKSTERELPLPEEETVQFNNDDVVLDFYTSDLNLTVNTDCLSASSKSHDALCFLWAGIRATYGFKQGKICYEIRITEIIDCPQMPDSEKEKFGIRLGWSNLSSGLHALQLGEFNDSYAYASSGKKMSRTNDGLVEDTYGESFGLSDVIACYIDFGADDDNLIRISFTKNGKDYGQAFEFSQTDSKEFYPHILVKNVKFECNFGQLENSWSDIKSDYTFVQHIPLEDRIRSSEPIADKDQCQVILLSGLNGSGKTTWAKKYIEENSKKDFNLLNVEHVFSKMTIDGKSPVIKDRNDGLMLRVNICLQKLIEIAAQRRRNYIVDHVNITRETQSKRQRLFTGYHRTAVVIIPDDDEFQKRLEKLEKLENISFPSQWIKEAKAKFYFPQQSSSLEDVIYPELSYDDAKSLYDKVRRDYEQYRSSSSRYDRHDDYHSSRSSNRNRYDDRERQSGDQDRNRDRYARSRSHERDRDRRSSRDDSRFSSSTHRNDNYRGGYTRGGGGGGGGSGGGGGRYSDHRQDSRNNQRGGFHEGGGNYRGRGGGYNNQSNDERRGGYQQQRNDFGGGRGRGAGDGFADNRNQYNNRGSYHDKQGGRGDGGFRQEFNNQSRGRQFNDYDNKQQQGGGRGFMQNNNSFNQHHDRQNFGPRPSIQQQQPQHSFHNQQQQQQQRPQPLLQNPPSNQQQQQQQQFPSNLTQQTANNSNLSLHAQNPLGINSLSNAGNVTQQNSLDPWLALYAAALNPQAAASQQQQQQQQQPTQQQDANSLTQQWAQWLKTAQMAQTAQQSQSQLTIQPNESHQQQQQTQIADASALYYQAYYAQLAAAQQQAAAAAAAAATGSMNVGVAPPGNGDK